MVGGTEKSNTPCAMKTGAVMRGKLAVASKVENWPPGPQKRRWMSGE
jgi:hypothetical protein